MARTPRPHSKLALALPGVGLALVALLAGHSPTAEAADDIDLLRKKGGQPYVFFLVDTSGSMVLDKDDNWVIANGDDPRSKIFQVKKALYEVMSGVESIHFGLASFNQDRVKVQSKHWLYGADAPANLGPFTYPSAVNEVWTFGRHVNSTGEAGTCASPLSLSAARQQLNRFPRLGLNGLETTTLWISTGGKTYRVRISLVPNSTSKLGSSTLPVHVAADEVITCPPLEVLGAKLGPVNVTFRRVQDFLMVESNGGSSTPDGPDCTADETMKSVWDPQDDLWPYTDVLAENTCGSGSSAPHTGQGWDGNTDSGDRPNPLFPGDDSSYNHDNFDACRVAPGEPGVCSAALPSSSDLVYNLRFPTVLHPDFDELDQGDVIPLSWDLGYKDEFLRRLNPRHPSYLPADRWDGDLANGEASPEEFRPFFGTASFFQDQPDDVIGLLQLKDERQRPLVAFGHSPLGRAITDFRCWYRGKESNKCSGGQDGPAFDPGWEKIFRDNSLEYGCRVPYLIVISDGENNSAGSSPISEVANLFSKAGVRTFVFTFKATDQLEDMVDAGKGELILVANGDDLATKLREIIGFVEEDSRAFASAAVPSVQAAVENKIYLTEFTPLDQAGAWDGHVHSFLKPLPLDDLSGRPKTEDPNHLWDAADVILLQSPPPVEGDTSGVDLKVGFGLDERRVFYAEEPDRQAIPPESWAEEDNRRLFTRDTNPSTSRLLAPDATPEERDLWDGLGLIYDPDDPESVQAARKEAFAIMEHTLIQKTYTSAETGTLTYILGDTFHSDPLVIGSPVNTLYFIQNAEADQGASYRDFFLTHENRRKIVVAGANDGMLHAWDGGRAVMVEFVDGFKIERAEVGFDNGTGRELFAYIPRSVLPTVTRMANDTVSHQWSVDGTVAAGDVFIDPLHGGTPNPGEREWRTVLIGGLREGGGAYYVLDLTHPDHLTTATARLGPEAAPLEEREVILSADRANPPIFLEDPDDSKAIPVLENDSNIVPDCINSITGDCPGPINYAAPLWEFTDRIWDPANRKLVALDEDGNDRTDLGETWSTPDVGRIRVVEDGEVVNKYVAIFGGGLDPLKAGGQGNFLYIVDFETGEVLYKRSVEGSVPSDPAAVDTDLDSFIDRVYFGTTAGFMYRLDLVDPSKSESDNARYPELATDLVTAINGLMFDTTRIEDDPRWEPVKIFDTANPGDEPRRGRAIYYPPTVQFVAAANRYAIGFGTGERDALGFKSDQTGRFYTFVDNSDPVKGIPATPLTASALTSIDLASDDHGDLLAGGGGWFLVLDLEERLISAPAGLIGITFFATFDPQVVNDTCEVGPSCKENPQCSLSGNSRIYLVETATANPLLATVDGVKRFMEVTGFVTEPFTEQGLSQNQVPNDPNQGPNADELTEREKEMMENFQSLMPANCKFGNHRIDIKLIAADTHLERIAAVPICIIEKNWMEVTE
jgi:hypothetical protein